MPVHGAGVNSDTEISQCEMAEGEPRTTQRLMATTWQPYEAQNQHQARGRAAPWPCCILHRHSAAGFASVMLLTRGECQMKQSHSAAGDKASWGSRSYNTTSIGVRHMLTWRFRAYVLMFAYVALEKSASQPTTIASAGWRYSSSGFRHSTSLHSNRIDMLVFRENSILNHSLLNSTATQSSSFGVINQSTASTLCASRSASSLVGCSMQSSPVYIHATHAQHNHIPVR